MNLPSQVARFGLLRLYWNGNNEHFVHIPKDVIENLRKTKSYLTTKISEMHMLNMIRYYQDFVNPPKMRDYKYGYQRFQNRMLSGFMINEYEDQMHVAYGVGERSISNCVTVIFEDKKSPK